jgi:hypothetical protein
MMDKKREILDAYNYRYACKDFDTDKKISEEDFAFILETGRLSPSSFGWEPWKFLVIQNKELREQLKQFAWGAQRQLPSASHFVILLARKAPGTKAGSDYIKHIADDIQQLPQEINQMKTEFYKKFQDKDFDLTDDRKLFDWASRQTYIPLANMMSSAAQINIDSCPIEGFDRANLESFLAKENMVDTEQFGVSAMVAFGYRAAGNRIPTKSRQSINDIAEWF